MFMNFRASWRGQTQAFVVTICVAAIFQFQSVGAEEQHGEWEFGGSFEADPVILSFSTVGDSREETGASYLTSQDAIWLQNSKAWSRIMQAIQAQKPDLLFFNGDMIMGYGKADVPSDTTSVTAIVNSDLVQFYKQYAFWRGMVAPLMEAGTYVVPVPGNHETQWKAGGKKSLKVNEDAWRANMGDLILDNARFRTLFGETPAFANVSDNAKSDSLSTDQTQLSYSFDFRGVHFVIINTDPVGNDAHAPVNWLRNDLAAAQGRGLKHFFVFGHKLAFTYYYPGADLNKPSGLDAVSDLSSRDAFWNLIEQYGATYFCGHEHIFNMTQPRANANPKGSAWQVIVGTGGSPFDAPANSPVPLNKYDRTYAWATVKVRFSGQVEITAYGFNDQYGPTMRLQSFKLPH